ncbi:hypothetical protein [Nitratireductor luteus]|uniref:hypothetical protein n=1 Tax=Nitratireductor luteus TaxID=2976980 RepID=UPI00223EE168|nr:hypothetical protein [Nitratireductor luteus]
MAHEKRLTLDEILSEPIVRKLMAADGVTATDIRKLYRSLESDRGNPPAFMCARLVEESRPQA